MKKRLLPVCMFLSLFLLTACQKTPIEDVVVNKNDNQLQEIISDTSNETVFEATSDVETYQDQFECKNENILFDVDAKIISDAVQYPVVQTVPHEITTDEVKHWADVLFEGADALEPPTEFSKSELEKMILSLKQSTDIDSLKEEYGDTDAVYNIQEIFNKDIASFEAMYETAPDVVERKITDWQFHPSSYYDQYRDLFEGDPETIELEKTNMLQVVTDDLGGYSYKLDAIKRTEDDYRVNIINFYRVDNELENRTDSEIVGSMDDTIRMVEEKLELLGLSDWELYYQDTLVNQQGNIYAYKLVYAPVYGDVREFAGGYVDLKSTDTYAAHYDYASLTVCANISGINIIDYVSPLDIVEIQNDNVKTLPFEDVYEHFKTQMESKYTLSSFIVFGEESNNIEHEVKIKVTSAREGMFRIREKAKEYSFLMVPAWVFTGEVYLDGDNWGETDLCYINAMDGSIIDPALGY